MFAMKRANKLLNFRPANSAVPSLCLQIDQVQAKPIFFNNTIYSLISTLANSQAGVMHRAAITHSNKQLDHKSFKELWGI